MDTKNIEDLRQFIGQLPDYEEVEHQKDDVISLHHQMVTHFMLLIEGTVNQYITLDHPKKDILVNKLKEPNTPLGWSGFNAPQRYSCKMRISSKKARLVRIPLQVLLDKLTAESAYEFVRSVGFHVYRQLKDSILRQGKSLPRSSTVSNDSLERYYLSPESSTTEITALMRRSPFLEFFEEDHLTHLANLAQRREYSQGELIYDQEEETEGLYLLIQGEVGIKRSENDRELSLRSISTPGFIFGWSSLLGSKDVCSAQASYDTSLYFIDRQSFEVLIGRDARFGTDFYLRLLWLAGNQLHVSHMRYLSLKLNHDQLSIHNLIEANRARLKLSSALHQIPHLLNDRNTLGLAYEKLHHLNTSGSTNERHLASLCLDLLKDGQNEFKFLQGLQNVYSTVVEENEFTDSLMMRRASAEAVRKAFKYVHYHIDGWEHLPEESGHIFIYNHLLNDPHYTLANNFQITLDSHFISSFILDEKYGDPGLRIVRLGKGAEYGHQNYYTRLDHINVYTRDSDQSSEDSKKEARRLFYEEGGDYLAKGGNLIISPEGVSHTTEESPGELKAGAFNLAMKQENEPLIVPIALCHFDRRITNNIFYCRILQPFKMSHRIENKEKESLKQFINQYQSEFKAEITKTISLANDLTDKTFS